MVFSMFNLPWLRQTKGKMYLCKQHVSYSLSTIAHTPNPHVETLTTQTLKSFVTNMKNYAIPALALATIALMGSCKSKESAYRQAFEKAKAQQTATTDNQSTVVAVNPVEPQNQERQVAVTPVTPVQTQTDNTDVRTINGGFTVVNGAQLKTYSVVVGSFVAQANAEGLVASLKAKGFTPSIVKTNETINGHTGWYRVIASSFDDKAQAVQSRNQLISSYAGAWLLYNK